MAIGCHVVRVGMVTINAAGVRVDKYAATTSIAVMANASSEPRVMEDASITNSAGYPTAKAYIEAEADDGYILAYMDQNTIVTYSAADINGAT